MVIVGNGIAGVTAADHVRRRHPDCQIDVVANEPYPLYNRMGIARLVYGSSAMVGLQLLPDSWYEENQVTCWLNTYATGLDRERRELTLGTGETLAYDRLILATGSDSFVPPIEGYGDAGYVRAAPRRGRASPSAASRRSTAPGTPWSPAAGCSGWRRRMRCTRSAFTSRCSSAARRCSRASSTRARRSCCATTWKGSGLHIALAAKPCR